MNVLSVKMASSQDDFVWVNGKAYNVKDFASSHPGGESFVGLYGGRDATDAFATYHRRAFPHKQMKEFAADPKSVSADPIGNRTDLTLV